MKKFLVDSNNEVLTMEQIVNVLHSIDINDINDKKRNNCYNDDRGFRVVKNGNYVLLYNIYRENELLIGNIEKIFPDYTVYFGKMFEYNVDDYNISPIVFYFDEDSRFCLLHVLNDLSCEIIQEKIKNTVIINYRKHDSDYNCPIYILDSRTKKFPEDLLKYANSLHPQKMFSERFYAFESSKHPGKSIIYDTETCKVIRYNNDILNFKKLGRPNRDWSILELLNDADAWEIRREGYKPEDYSPKYFNLETGEVLDNYDKDDLIF